jgi:hypothetical protein
MKMYGEGGGVVQIHVFMTWILVGSEWPASGTGRYALEKDPPVPVGREVGWIP